MYIKCWGSRGSIPVSGQKYLKYGGDTTCLEIRSESDDIIIIDAGTGIRRLGNRLMDEGRFEYNLIFTHAHWDHVMGFPFFKPIFSSRSKFVMHRCPFHSKFVETILSRVMAPPNFPVKLNELKACMEYKDACPVTFQIGSVDITPIPLSHPNGGSGYKFRENGKVFVFLTDNELGFIHPGGKNRQEYLDFSTGADLLIHDAEYTPEEYKTQMEWGHSDFTATLDLALEAGVKQLGLFHINQERTDDQVDQMVNRCQQIITEQNSSLKCFAVAADMEFQL